MNIVSEQLLDLLKEKWIVKDILDMKYEMEHREKMKKICKNINEMTCFILNTTEELDIEEGRIPDVHTQLIFHDKLDENTSPEEAVEYYIFAYQEHEVFEYRYINRIINNRGEPYLNKKEYYDSFDITLSC